jgi:hypothetical protein
VVPLTMPIPPLSVMVSACWQVSPIGAGGMVATVTSSMYMPPPALKPSITMNTVIGAALGLSRRTLSSTPVPPLSSAARHTIGVASQLVAGAPTR